MRLSRTLAYAIQAMVLLSDQRGKGSLTCHQMAKAAGMPERFLLQLLRSLVRSGLLRSSRGVHGGYWLERAPEEITLLEIFEAVDGPLEFKDSPSPVVRSDRLETALCDVRDQIRAELGAISLSSVLGDIDEGSDDDELSEPAALVAQSAPVDTEAELAEGAVERSLVTT